MGTFINIGNTAFAVAKNSGFVDKSGLISVINSTIDTERCFSCVTRSRRFGKSMAAKMLCAYYDKSCDSRHLFEGLDISRDDSFEKYLNKYAVIFLDLSAFAARFNNNANILEDIQHELKADIMDAYPDVSGLGDSDSVMQTLLKITEQKGERFFLIIDEWDSLCRENKTDSSIMDTYVAWLRSMFKNVNATRVFAGVYMTGILPIKKYKTESALNNFREYSMIMPRKLDRYFCFTREEVQALCKKYCMDYDELEKWYDGYRIGEQSSIFNPNSVMEALDAGICDSYWATTGAYENVSQYIKMNFEGLKDDIIMMLAGGRCKVNTTSFVNDMSIINNKDDVFTVLIHLGYLAYDKKNKECYIPNKEVGDEMINAINSNGWKVVANALATSDKLLRDTLNCDAASVAAGIEKVHEEETSVLSYNDENSLACVLSLAYYSAKDNYVFHREMATGKGFADLVLIPRKHVNEPAILLELKYDKDADTAISQIKNKNNTNAVSQYSGNIILVGINYDKKSKTHTCVIEKIAK